MRRPAGATQFNHATGEAFPGGKDKRAGGWAGAVLSGGDTRIPCAGFSPVQFRPTG